MKRLIEGQLRGERKSMAMTSQEVLLERQPGWNGSCPPCDTVGMGMYF